jgi:hypothetical protein
MLNQSVGCIIESEIIPDKCQWLTRPGTCIIRSRNNVIVHSFFQTFLSVLGYSRAREYAEARPVIDGGHFAQKSVNPVSAHLKRMREETPEHANSKWFLFWPGGGPCLTLRNSLAQVVWVQMNLFLIHCLGINNYSGFEHKEIQTLGGGNDVISQALLSKGTFQCRRETVTHFHFRDLGPNEIDREIIAYALSRLLLKSDSAEPTSKVSKLRVNRRAVRPPYVPSVSPKEISSATLDSSSRRRRQIWHD